MFHLAVLVHTNFVMVYILLMRLRLSVVIEIIRILVSIRLLMLWSIDIIGLILYSSLRKQMVWIRSYDLLRIEFTSSKKDFGLVNGSVPFIVSRTRSSGPMVMEMAKMPVVSLWVMSSPRGSVGCLHFVCIVPNTINISTLGNVKNFPLFRLSISL